MKYTEYLFGITLFFACSACTSIPSRSLYIPEVALSELHETTVFFDSRTYDGFGLSIRNDLESDIFLIDAPWTPLLSEPYNTESAFRLPDRDERFELSQYEMRFSENPTQKSPHFETPPHYLRYMFIFIWSGNAGSFHYFFDALNVGETYFLPITYYDTEVGGFHTRSIRIVVGRKQNAGGNE